MSMYNDIIVKMGKYPKVNGDPEVIKDGNIYRGFHTSPNIIALQGCIASSTSTNGIDWKPVNAGLNRYGFGTVLIGIKGGWDEQLETAFCFKHNDLYLLYYCGYPKIGWPTNPGQIGLALSYDGVKFKRYQNKPIITNGDYDSNGLYSPSIIFHNNKFFMVYCGHCYSSTTVIPGIRLLHAVSENGIHWEKLGPLIWENAEISWLKDGCGEPHIFLYENKYYLLITGNLGGEDKRCIGIARSDSPYGPYEIKLDPIIVAKPNTFNKDGVLAPSIIIENNIMKVWYLTSDLTKEEHMIGYTEISWPINW